MERAGAPIGHIERAHLPVRLCGACGGVDRCVREECCVCSMLDDDDTESGDPMRVLSIAGEIHRGWRAGRWRRRWRQGSAVRVAGDAALTVGLVHAALPKAGGTPNVRLQRQRLGRGVA